MSVGTTATSNNDGREVADTQFPVVDDTKDMQKINDTTTKMAINNSLLSNNKKESRTTKEQQISHKNSHLWF